MQPRVTKPRSATTKAVPKATAETEQGSQQEGIPTEPVGGEPDSDPETKQEPPGGEAIKSKNAQERESQVKIGRSPTFWGRCIPTSPPENTKDTIKQEQRAQGGPDQDKRQGGKIILDDNQKKPQDPKDIALRKLFVGNMNADTNRAVMQRYFKKFGEVARCFHVMKKGSNTYEGYGFVIFKAAEAVDEVQRARPHTIHGQAVRTRRDVPDEETKKKNKNLCFSRVQEPLTVSKKIP